MEEINSMWSYQESVEELKQKLLSTAIELEHFKLEASELMRKNKEDVMQLIQLIEMICQERDEARNQLQKLLNRFFSSSDFYPDLQPDVWKHPVYMGFSNGPGLLDNPLIIIPTKANSRLTESNSNSSPCNHAFFDTVTSDFSNINVDNFSNIAFVNPWLVQVNDTNVIPSVMNQACLVIENLVERKPLPQRGKYAEAVVDAGPLLQNLIVGGLLPRWRNPPPMETLDIPSVSVASNLSHIASRSLNSTRPYAEMSCAVSSQILSTSMLNVENGTCGSSLGSDVLTTSCANANGCATLCKKQRLH